MREAGSSLRTAPAPRVERAAGSGAAGASNWPFTAALYGCGNGGSCLATALPEDFGVDKDSWARGASVVNGCGHCWSLKTLLPREPEALGLAALVLLSCR